MMQNIWADYVPFRVLGCGGAEGALYRNVAAITNNAPMEKFIVKAKSWKKIPDTTADRMIERAEAKLFIMLSAYLV